ncbi:MULTISPECIES: hypothetical protein [unclassified Vibrio]|uniref:hypothetical protein n=1 Tax=unclassified Vibrio TaxID=2614977 RepID=UPI00354F5484
MKFKYPNNWGYFDGYVQVHQQAPNGFKNDISLINRFAARYRVAASFNGLNLDNFSESTEAGYSGLCRVFLAWSAYEVFLKIIELKASKTESLLSRYDSGSVARQIRAMDTGDKFYNFIYERVNKAHQTELAKYFQVDECNPQYLASAVRHIFAHGTLSANANEVSPKTVELICDLLADFLLKVMDHEFSNIIEKHKAFEGIGY